MVVENDILADSRLEGLAGNVNVCSYLSANAADFVLLKVNKKLDARQARLLSPLAPSAGQTAAIPAALRGLSKGSALKKADPLGMRFGLQST